MRAQLPTLAPRVEQTQLTFQLDHPMGPTKAKADKEGHGKFVSPRLMRPLTFL